MFVSSEKFIGAHGGRIGDIAIYGRNPATPGAIWQSMFGHDLPAIVLGLTPKKAAASVRFIQPSTSRSWGLWRGMRW
jgi:hypothetical protein